MPEETPQSSPSPVFFGLPLDVLKTGGTVLILLAILWYTLQTSNSKDQAYIALATSNQALTIQIQALNGKVDDLTTVVTSMRIQFARGGLDVPVPPATPTK